MPSTGPLVRLPAQVSNTIPASDPEDDRWQPSRVAGPCFAPSVIEFEGIGLTSMLLQMPLYACTPYYTCINASSLRYSICGHHAWAQGDSYMSC